MSNVEFGNWQEEQMEKLLAAENDAVFFARLSGMAADLGFDRCAYGMRMPLPLSNPKMVMLNNYSAEWQHRYAEKNYLAVDPTVAHGLRSVMPVVWSDKLFANCPQLWDEAREHGLRVGWAQSSYDARGVGGLLTLARKDGPLSAAELRGNGWKMSWLAQVAHEGLSRLLADKRAPEREISLTPREIEVLRWSADGKTSSEVGEILNISERTVNFHVNNSLEKLGATNKTAGVIKAALLRLL
jgi:LuxR family transcriptional regulator, quorum-sensing system regulator SolR